MIHERIMEIRKHILTNFLILKVKIKKWFQKLIKNRIEFYLIQKRFKKMNQSLIKTQQSFLRSAVAASQLSQSIKELQKFIEKENAEWSEKTKENTTDE